MWLNALLPNAQQYIRVSAETPLFKLKWGGGLKLTCVSVICSCSAILCLSLEPRYFCCSNTRSRCKICSSENDERDLFDFVVWLRCLSKSKQQKSIETSEHKTRILRRCYARQCFVQLVSQRQGITRQITESMSGTTQNTMKDKPTNCILGPTFKYIEITDDE